eukprot:Opistho-2@35349
MARIAVLVAVAGCIALAALTVALENGLGRTPPLGWMTWERFRCNVNCTADPTACISEKLIMEMADRMAADGYLEAGYEYVDIDDCWLAPKRDADNKMVADPERFPSGIKKLAAYVHSKGLKLGIYEDFGTMTCAGYPGSENYLKIDAETFASWDVDALKFDGCNSEIKDMTLGYPRMGQFLAESGRKVLYSCSWPDYVRYFSVNSMNLEQVAAYCNIWRVF